jgi:hypothetical protein
MSWLSRFFLSAPPCPTNESYSATSSTGPYARSSAASVPHTARGMRSSCSVPSHMLQPWGHRAPPHWHVRRLRRRPCLDAVHCKANFYTQPFADDAFGFKFSNLVRLYSLEEAKTARRESGRKERHTPTWIGGIRCKNSWRHTRSIPYSKDKGIRARQGLMGHLALLGSRCKQRCVHVAAAERRELQGEIDWWRNSPERERDLDDRETEVSIQQQLRLSLVFASIHRLCQT